MKTTLVYLLILSPLTAILFGCSIPKHSGVLMHPAGFEKNQRNIIHRECMKEAQNLSKTPLTENESNLIKDVETSRFFQGGRGRDDSADRYVLCFLNKDYQLLIFPTNFFSETGCEVLSKYKTAGIEKERLKYLCKEKDTEKCAVCQ